MKYLKIAYTLMLVAVCVIIALVIGDGNVEVE